MLNTLNDIFQYANEQLLGGELDTLSELIEYLEEAQQKIAQAYPIQAPVLTFPLTGNQITLPAGFSRLARLTVNGTAVQVTESPWAGVLTLPAQYTEGTCSLWYYKNPTPLNVATPTQVPDIAQRFFYAMAQYAARMYYLVDDDSEMREAFRSQFFESLTAVSGQPQTISNFSNVW